jgi:hypothetical protein
MLGSLDIVTNRLDERLEHTIETLLCDSAALLALANLLRMDEHRLHIRVATTRAHERYRQERTSLVTD